MMIPEKLVALVPSTRTVTSSSPLSPERSIDPPKVRSPLRASMIRNEPLAIRSMLMICSIGSPELSLSLRMNDMSLKERLPLPMSVSVSSAPVKKRPPPGPPMLV